jgi:hypothetical protein
MGKKPNSVQQNRRRIKRGLRLKGTFAYIVRTSDAAKSYTLRHTHQQMPIVQSKIQYPITDG